MAGGDGGIQLLYENSAGGKDVASAWGSAEGTNDQFKADTKVTKKRRAFSTVCLCLLAAF